MKKFITFLILAIFSLTFLAIDVEAKGHNNKGKRPVKAYKKKNGTYVKKHSRNVHYGH